MALAFPKPEKRGKKPRKRLPTKKVRQKKAKQKCLALWSRIIKHGQACRFIGQIVGREIHKCSGGLQACHGIARGPHPAVRVKLWNGFAACAAAHVFFTHHPESWGLFLAQEWGIELYEERIREASALVKIDYEQELVNLETKAREHGL